MRTKIFIFIMLLVPSIALCEERTYTVAGHSMEPALLPGDRVVVGGAHYLLDGQEVSLAEKLEAQL